MSAGAALEAGRALARTLMIDRVRVRRVAGVTTDPLSGKETPTYEDVYEGAAKVQTFEAFENNPEVSGYVGTTQRYTIHLPVGAYTPKIKDLVTVTAAAFDENLVGREYRVVGLLHKSMATAYRLMVSEGVG